nr:hypothetical protein Itr_chr11CG21000 [Ipomoea trifida]
MHYPVQDHSTWWFSGSFLRMSCPSTGPLQRSLAFLKLGESTNGLSLKSLAIPSSQKQDLNLHSNFLGFKSEIDCICWRSLLDSFSSSVDPAISISERTGSMCTYFSKA